LSNNFRVWRRIACATTLSLVLVPAAVALPATAAPASSSWSTSTGVAAATVSGDDWTVSEVAGGYSVTLTLSEPLPVRSASPSLLVDGEDLGPALESADGLTLSLTTTDPRVLTAGDISLGWDGVAETGNAGSAARQAAPVEPAPTALADVLASDPSTMGQYTVARADYNLGDEAIDLAGMGIRGELTGAVYYPAEKTTESPVVMYMHGRHTSCAGTAPEGSPRWPCAPGQTNVPSYLGYDDSAEVLASNGYVVVSIAANAINANDNQLADDRGALARGQLILDSLDLMAGANAGTAAGLDPVLKGRLDLDHIGLMGHSRGGEGVTRAAILNATRETPYAIEAVLPLAPTDFSRMTLPDVPTAVILPYCDGDVVNLQGQHIIDDSRHAFGDSVLRSSVLVMGTNHNFFNTIWTPSIYPTASSDDWRAQDRDQVNPDCGATAAPARLTADEQRAVGTAYIAGFFRLTMGAEEQFVPLFDGSDSTVVSAGRADVRVTATQPSDNRLDVQNFTAPTRSIQTAGSATAQVCASLSGRPVAGALPFCATTLTTAQAVHWTPATYAPSVDATPLMHFTWAAQNGELRVPVSGASDVSAFENLSFKISPDENVVGSTDLTVTVLDGSGGTQSLPVSSVGDALSVLPGTGTPLRKVILQNVLVPVASLTDVDLTDIREIRFTAATPTGGVYLSDVAFTTAAVGTPAISSRPFVSVANTVVEEGAGRGDASVAVLLSGSSTETVTAAVSGLGSASGTVGVVSDTVTFAPGETCKTVTLPVYGNSAASPIAGIVYQVVASVSEKATMGDTFGTISVREDDGVVDVAGAPLESLPPVGVQGDACAEATAVPGALTLTPTEAPAGSSVTVAGSGYRVGEAVLVSYGTAAIAPAVVVSTDGTVTSTASIPADTAAGTLDFLALGAGSGFLRTASFGVLAAPVDPAPVPTDPGTAVPVPDAPGTPGVLDPADGGDDSVVVPAAETPRADGSLASTGVEIAGWAALAALLTAAGAALLVMRRRKRDGVEVS
jgi:LPXTG-motif cell wall-anchored protein